MHTLSFAEGCLHLSLAGDVDRHPDEPGEDEQAERDDQPAHREEPAELRAEPEPREHRHQDERRGEERVEPRHVA